MEITTTKDYIYQKINAIGNIKNFKEFPLRNEPNFKRILMKIEWKNHADKIEKNIHEKGGYINIVYEMPKFWKVVEAR
jgi:hypothetical protein